MTTSDTYRDAVPPDKPTMRHGQAGRAYVAVVGIDRYRAWNRLYNAVSDASGALKLFTGLGFELVGSPLFDERATGDALHRLVFDDLSSLGREDSLVLFFAGHGHTMTRTYDGTSVKDGYIIPVDGDRPGGHAGTWIRLESWLTEVTRIPAKHILVVLDACHSGVALGPILRWRSRGMEMAHKEPLEQLRARRSRRIITSALDDQLAMDGGPVPGHSLFTGCLIEAITGGLFASTGHRVVTGSEIGLYVQRRVSEYPRSLQTPDFGALELDDRGELLVRVAVDAAGTTVEDTAGRNKLYAAGSDHPDPAVGAASQPPSVSEQPRPSRNHELRRSLGGGMVAIVGAIIAAALATRDGISSNDAVPALGVQSDSVAASSVAAPPGGALVSAPPVVVPLDGGLTVAAPDAAYVKSSEPSPRRSLKRRAPLVVVPPDAALVSAPPVVVPLDAALVSAPPVAVPPDGGLTGLTVATHDAAHIKSSEPSPVIRTDSQCIALRTAAAGVASRMKDFAITARPDEQDAYDRSVDDSRPSAERDTARWRFDDLYERNNTRMNILAAEAEQVREGFYTSCFHPPAPAVESWKDLFGSSDRRRFRTLIGIATELDRLSAAAATPGASARAPAPVGEFR